MRKRDKVPNALKATVKSCQLVYQKVKRVLNPRSVMLGFLFTWFMMSNSAFAVELPSVSIVEYGWQSNVTVVTLILAMFEESTYYSSHMIPGSSWFHSKIGPQLWLWGRAHVQEALRFVPQWVDRVRLLSAYVVLQPALAN